MLAEFNMSPSGQKGLSKYVAQVIEIVRNSGLQYQLNSMGTIIEGDTDEVFDLIKKCQKHLASQAERVYTVIKIDDKIGKTNQMNKKINSVVNKIDGDVNTAK